MIFLPITVSRVYLFPPMPLIALHPPTHQDTHLNQLDYQLPITLSSRTASHQPPTAPEAPIALHPPMQQDTYLIQPEYQLSITLSPE